MSMAQRNTVTMETCLTRQRAQDPIAAIAFVPPHGRSVGAPCGADAMLARPDVGVDLPLRAIDARIDPPDRPSWASAPRAAERMGGTGA